MTSSTADRFYYLKDHLGNIRVTVNTSGAKVGNDDFYPFGMLMDGRSSASSTDARFKFTSKERDSYETEYDYFGARYYDARIGRWLVIDPLDNKFPEVAPYVYSHNDPINRLDPDGKADGPAKQFVMNQSVKQLVGFTQERTRELSLRFGNSLSTTAMGMTCVGAGVLVTGAVITGTVASAPLVLSGGILLTGANTLSGIGTISKIMADSKNTSHYVDDIIDVAGGQATKLGGKVIRKSLGNDIDEVVENFVSSLVGMFDSAINIAKWGINKEIARKKSKDEEEKKETTEKN